MVNIQCGNCKYWKKGTETMGVCDKQDGSRFGTSILLETTISIDFYCKSFEVNNE